jgi:hypothetical protein
MRPDDINSLAADRTRGTEDGQVDGWMGSHCSILTRASG